VQLQERRHAHEKEMQQQKLQHEKHLQQDVNVVHHQQNLLGENLLAEGLQVLLAEGLQVLLAEGQQEDLVHKEEDVNRLSFFFYFNKLNEVRPINFVPKFQ
jgi:hypothetical protein